MRPRDPNDSLPMLRFLAAAACTLGLATAMMRVAGAADAAPALSSAAEDITAVGTLATGELDPIVVSSQRLDDSLWEKNTELDAARDKNLLPKLGATDYSIDQQDLQTLPQGKNTPLDKVVLQIPGVSYDSAISNPDFHVRNEYANVQYRINGIQLPDGVSALGSGPRNRFCRQHESARRDPAGPVRVANCRRARHHDEEPSSIRRQPRSLRGELGNGKPERRVRRQRGAIPNTSSPGAISERSGPRERHADGKPDP